MNYPLTARSVLTLEFRSDDEPEFAGIGLDDDEAYEDAKLFKLYGTQGFGIRTFDTYQGTGWQTYTIPIGEFYTGDMQYL